MGCANAGFLPEVDRQDGNKVEVLALNNNMVSFLSSGRFRPALVLGDHVQKFGIWRFLPGN
jgi:hypothetical protein